MAENLSLIAISISFISVVIAGLGFVLSVKKSKMEKLTHESQFISNIHNELSKIEQRLDSLKNPDDCLHYAVDYTNALEKLCFFNTKKYLSKEIIDFFKNYLKYGLGYYNWLLDIDALKDAELKNHYSNLVKSCSEYNISPPDSLQDRFEEHRDRIKNMKKG